LTQNKVVLCCEDIIDKLNSRYITYDSILGSPHDLRLDLIQEKFDNLFSLRPEGCTIENSSDIPFEIAKDLDSDEAKNYFDNSDKYMLINNSIYLPNRFEQANVKNNCPTLEESFKSPEYIGGYSVDIKNKNESCAEWDIKYINLLCDSEREVVYILYYKEWIDDFLTLVTILIFLILAFIFKKKLIFYPFIISTILTLPFWILSLIIDWRGTKSYLTSLSLYKELILSLFVLSFIIGLVYLICLKIKLNKELKKSIPTN